jgi:hypothetical protein
MSDEGHGGLDGIEEAYEAAEVEREMERDRLLDVWDRNKWAMAGMVVICPVCGRSFRKLTASHVFCRRKGPGNCKDRFWNTVNDERRERAAIMNR